MNKKFLKRFDYFILVVELILSGLLVFQIKDLLPMNFLMIIMAVLLLLLGLNAYFLLFKKTKKSKHGKAKKESQHWGSRVLCLLLSIILAIGNIAAIKGFSALGNITSGRYETTVISVAVLKDSKAKELKDLEGMNVGIISTLEKSVYDDVIKDLEKEVSVQLDQYKLLDKLCKSLIDEEQEAIIFNEGLRGLIEEIDPEFEKETRIIHQFEFKKEIQNVVSKKNDVTKNPFSIFVSGIDTYGPVNTVSRSDVNMVVTINPKTHHILLTSIPRDYYVELASFGAMDKLTHAGIYGVSESQQTIANLLGIDIQYYARVNFSSVLTIVDALGGITVNNDQGFDTVTGKYFSEGENWLSGQDALDYARERYNLPNGDNDRVKNQQEVITGILNKAMSSAIITNYSSILDAISGSFQTDMESKDIQKLISMQLKSMSGWTIESVQLSGFGDTSYDCYSYSGEGLYVMQPDEASVQAAHDKIIEVIGE